MRNSSLTFSAKLSLVGLMTHEVEDRRDRRHPIPPTVLPINLY
ncbi:hypothetical protein [Phormidium sp. FACHB-592]|nr:hypothetical protein [Phormidium sp. FACHB-592]